MGEKRQKATDGAMRSQVRQQWPVRRGLVAASALAALCFLAACSGSVATTAGHVPSAVANTGSAADGRSVQGLGVPSIISRAIASGRAVAPTRKATHKPAAKQKTKRSASPSAAAQPSATRPRSSGTSTGTSTGGQSGGQSGGDPSGENPATSLSGFTLKYVQEFNGDSAPTNWTIYDAVPGGYSPQVAQWVPSMCTFSGGEARFMASGIDSCGMKYLGGSQEYGAWFVRMQADYQPSNEWFSDIFLLWPTNLQWPPEIDVYEDRGDRSRTYASLINTVGDACGAAPTFACLTPYEQTNGPAGGVANSDTDWHTYGVEWTPSGVSWLIDGNVIFSAPASQTPSGAQQPALAMDIALQSQNLQGAGTPALIQTMSVDWMTEFSWNG
jgi:hypothetical protein